MTEINLNVRRNNIITIITRVLVVLVLWICLVVSGLFFFITQENDKKILADQRVELMMEQLNELQVEALGLFIYSTNIVPHSESSVIELSEKEQVLQARLSAELDEMVNIYQDIEGFPTIELDIDALLNLQDVSEKELIIDVFQEKLAIARNVLHEFKWLKNQEYLVNFQSFQEAVIALTLITLLGVIFTFLLIRKRVSLGLDNVLNLVRKYNHKQYAFIPDWPHNDEFREIFFHLQQLKEFSLVNSSVIERDKRLLEHYFQNIQEPCLALNTDRRYVFCNKLFEIVWSEYQVELESSLCDNDELSLDLVDIKIASLEENPNLPSLFKFNGLTYSLNEETIHDNGQLMGYLLKFTPVSDELEYEAVTKIVALMSADVWNAPIRVLREESRVASLAKQLEKIRLSVVNLLNLFDGMSLNDEAQKVESLKDISELIILLSESLNDTKLTLESKESEFNLITEKAEDEILPPLDFTSIQDVVKTLREKVEASIFESSKANLVTAENMQELETNLLQGYENLNQSLSIVYKGVESSVSAIEESASCMSEVKVALANAILDKEDAASDNDELQSVAIDLSHDIDTVAQLLSESLQQEKASLAKLDDDIESCQNRTTQIKAKLENYSHNEKENGLVSQCESMMQDVFSLDNALDDLIKNSKP
ncbi:hypothetical protein MED121_06070 [Marinomonas sp. MED121]|uniref:hypothetical protein n=1 Tax=Marinomonas sp. MED121 TaxID=314277 RepID=UPI000069043C|nr:hypothetical protein [Marinomonas sp. MED121]EAQ66225.1 hypothetical protein MED121_06070 [Marinomonas sp. MED121]